MNPRASIPLICSSLPLRHRPLVFILLPVRGTHLPRILLLSGPLPLHQNKYPPHQSPLSLLAVLFLRWVLLSVQALLHWCLLCLLNLPCCRHAHPGGHFHFLITQSILVTAAPHLPSIPQICQLCQYRACLQPLSPLTPGEDRQMNTRGEAQPMTRSGYWWSKRCRCRYACSRFNGK